MSLLMRPRARRTLDPSSIVKKLRRIRTFADVHIRLGDIFKLLFKIMTGRYSTQYWNRRKEGNIASWSGPTKKQRRDFKQLSHPPHKISWDWDIIKSCNYKCEYCFYGGCDDTGTLFLDPEIWERIWANISDLYGSCHIHIAGGEPTRYPNFFKIMELLSKTHSLQLSTNLSFDVNEIIERMPRGRLMISASFHPSQVGLDAFTGKIKKLIAAGFSVLVSYVAHPRQLFDTGKYRSRIEALAVPFYIHPFRGIYKGAAYPSAYDSEEMGFLHDLAPAQFPGNKECAESRKVAPVDSSGARAGRPSRGDRRALSQCRMGQMFGKIYSDGSVHRCCASGSRKIGNITDPNFRLLKYALTCDADECNCQSMLVSAVSRR